MKEPLLILFLTLFILSLFCGCAYDGPPVSFTGSYTNEDGAAFGGGVRIDPSYAKQK